MVYELLNIGIIPYFTNVRMGLNYRALLRALRMGSVCVTSG